MMKITVLADNIGGDGLRGEWGLSLHIEYEGRRFLLDTGATGAFLANAVRLGISIADVDCAIISHAHYDHAGGLAAFFEANGKAPVYLSPEAGENCYGGLGFVGKYIGMPKGVVALHPGRFLRPEGVAQISDGVYLVPHTTAGLQRLGRRNHLYVRKGFMRYSPDDFSHEQTLVFKTVRGLALMNSCSHSGAEVVVDEVLKAFPGERITAYIGGLHLFRLNNAEVQAVSDRLASCGIERIYTGHCTGRNAFDILKRHFGENIQQFRCGMRIEI